MSYIKKPTAAEQRKREAEKSILSVAEAVNHTASVMKSAHTSFWSGDPVQKVADLNADPAGSIALFQANAELGTVLNKHLDALGIDRYGKRVPLAIGHPDITFDGKAFVYTEPVIEDLDPE